MEFKNEIENFEIIEQLDQTCILFKQLSIEEKKKIVLTSDLNKTNEKVLKIYFWINEILEQEQNSFSIPAMLIPCILEYEYTNSNSKSNLVQRILKEHGEENIDWKIFSKSELSKSKIIFKKYSSPTNPEKYIEFSINDANKTSYPMITPLFAKKLILRSRSKIGEMVLDFFIKANKKSVNFLKEKHSELGEIFEANNVKRKRDVKNDLDDSHSVKKFKDTSDMYILQNQILEENNRIQTQNNAILAERKEWLTGLNDCYQKSTQLMETRFDAALKKFESLDQVFKKDRTWLDESNKNTLVKNFINILACDKITPY